MNIEWTLKKRRAELGMTQKEVAELLCVAETTYQKWEVGRNEPPPSKLEMMSEKMQIPITDFFGSRSEGEKGNER